MSKQLTAGKCQQQNLKEIYVDRTKHWKGCEKSMSAITENVNFYVPEMYFGHTV